MLHKHFVIFRSIYYTGKLNKQINNGPAESFSISYSYLTRFTLCLWNLISYFLFVFVVAVFFFLQTLMFRKKCSAAGKGGKDHRDPLLNYFTFGWFLNSM